jgi:hypothetical protein
MSTKPILHSHLSSVENGKIYLFRIITEKKGYGKRKAGMIRVKFRIYIYYVYKQWHDIEVDLNIYTKKDYFVFNCFISPLLPTHACDEKFT